MKVLRYLAMATVDVKLKRDETYLERIKELEEDAEKTLSQKEKIEAKTVKKSAVDRQNSS